MTDTSWVSGVGPALEVQADGTNRTDNTFVPDCAADVPECIDDFGFLWFEDECVASF